LQPKYEFSKENGDSIYVCIIPNKMNDPRLNAIKMYNKNVDNKSKLFLGKKNKLLKDNHNYNKYRNDYFKKKRSSRDDKKMFKCASP